MLILKKKQIILVFLLIVGTSIFAQSPGGVANNLNLWLKADKGITETAGGVSGWLDQSSAANNASQATASQRPILINNTFNHNPALNYITGGNLMHLLGSKNDTYTDLFIVTRIDTNSEVFSPVFKNVVDDTNSVRIDTYRGSGWRTFGNFNEFSIGGIFLVNGLNTGGAHNNLKHYIYAQKKRNTNTGSFTYALGQNTNTNSELDGLIAEVIGYGANLSATDKQKIDSYVSIKYGITFAGGSRNYLSSTGTTVWQTEPTYKNDIFGIANDSGSALNQQISSSLNTDGVMVISTSSNLTAANDGSRPDLDANQYIIVANDNGNNTYVTTGAPAGDFKILNRKWKITNSTSASKTIFFGVNSKNSDFNLFKNIISGQKLFLVVDSNKDGSFADETPVAMDSKGGFYSTAKGVVITGGELFTIATEDLKDTDGDGVLDINDLDDDNDGILDTDENCIPYIGAEENGTFGTLPSTNPYRDLQTNPGGGYIFGNGVNQLYPEARYAVITFLSSPHSGRLWNFRGHTTNTNDDAYLAVNGNTSPGTFYRETVNLIANTEYVFGFWHSGGETTSIFRGYELEMTVYNPDGSLAASSNTGKQSTVGWKQLQQFFIPPISGKYSFEVKSTSVQSDGNDFAIDDISFTITKCSADNDKDGIPDNLDLDSDNDGIPDNIEAQSKLVNYIAPNTDNAAMYTLNKGVNSAYLTTSNTGSLGLTPHDTDKSTTDGDGSQTLPDFLDTDSDGTEGNDTVEAALTLTGSVGKNGLDANLETADDYTDVNGTFSNNPLAMLPDALNDKLPDFRVYNIPVPGGYLEYLTLWLKANDNGNILTDGSALTTWEDKSGTSNNGTTNAGSPIYQSTTDGINFNPVVEFTNDAVKTSNKAVYGANGVYTKFIVLKPQNLGAGNLISSFGNNENALFTPGNKLTIQHNTVNVLNGATALASNNTYVASVRYSAGNTTINNAIRLDGKIDAANTNRVNYANVDEIMIGANSGPALFTTDAAIAEAIVYTKAMTNAEINRVESYLAIKYGTTLNDGNTAYNSANGTEVWAVEPNYKTNIFGIAKDDIQALNQQISKSVNTGAILTVSTDTDFTTVNGTRTGLTDGQFLLVGNNGSSGAVPTTANTIDLDVTKYSTRTAREWKSVNTGAVGEVNLKFDGYDDTWVLLTRTTDDYFSQTTGTKEDQLSSTGTVAATLTGTTYFTLAKKGASIEFESATANGLENVGDNLPNLIINGTLRSDTTIDVMIGGTATAGTDYVLGAVAGVGSQTVTVTIPAGIYSPASPVALNTLTTFTITPDTTVEPDETIDLTLSNAGLGLAIAEVTGGSLIDKHTYTITNDDTSIEFESSIANGLENVGDNLPNLIINGTLVSDTTIDVTIGTLGTATLGTDYVLGGATGVGSQTVTVTIPAGIYSSGTPVALNTLTTFTITGDTTVEPDETIDLTLSNAGSGLTIAEVVGGTLISNHVYTITNDDSAASIEFESSTANGLENVGDNLPNLIIHGTLAFATTIDVLIGGTATLGTDYVLGGATGVGSQTVTVTIPAGIYNLGTPVALNTLTTFTITGDTTVEPDETIDLTLSNARPGLTIAEVTGGSLIDKHTYTITNDDTSIEFASVTANGFENVGDNLPNLIIKGTLALDTTVDVTIGAGGTATLGTDYVFGGATIGGAQTVTITIPAGTYSSSSGTPVALSSLTTFTITPDTTVEPDETIDLTLSNAGLGLTIAEVTGGSLIDKHTYTITNDDTSIEFESSTANGLENVGDNLPNLIINGTLASDTTIDVTIGAGGTATLGTDYVLGGASGVGSQTVTVTIPAGIYSLASPVALNTLTTFTITGDTTVEPDETIDLTLSNAQSGLTIAEVTGGSLIDKHTYTITNDDTSIEFESATSNGLENVGDNLPNLIINGTLASDTTIDVLIGAGGTATLGTDYVLGGATGVGSQTVTVTIPAGTYASNSPVALNTLTTFTITGDTTVELDETIDLTLSNAGSGLTIAEVTGGTLISNHVYTITNDDSAASIEFESATANGFENVGDNLPNLIIDGTLASAITIDVTIGSGGTATLGTDYVFGGASGVGSQTVTVTIPAGIYSSATPVALNTLTTFTITGDTLYESNETIDLTLNNAQAGLTIQNVLGGALISNHTYTIRNDDIIATTAIGTLISTSDTSRIADGVESATISVQLKDVDGNDIATPGIAVLFSTSLGTLSSTTPVVTNALGLATVTLVSTTSGPASVTARVDTDGDNTVDASVTNGSPVVVTFIAGPLNTTVTGTEMTADVTSIEANGTDASTITVQLKDVNGNNITTSGINVSFATTGSASLSATNPVATVNGVATIKVTNTTSETVSITATLDIDNNPSTPDVKVNNGSPISIIFNAGKAVAGNSTITATSPIWADGIDTSTVTLQLIDAYNNLIKIGGESISNFVLSSGTSTTAALGTITDNNNGTYTFTVSNTVVETVTISAQLSGASFTNTANIEFIPAADPTNGNSNITATSPVVADGTSTSTVTVQLFDSSGNPIISSRGTVTLAVSGSAIISKLTDNGKGVYTATITNTVAETISVTGKLNGVDITETGGALTTANVLFIPGAAAPNNSDTTIDATSPVVANNVDVSTITVKLADANGNLLTSSGGILTLTSSSTTATISNVVDNLNGTYTATIKNTVVETVTISGLLDGVKIKDTADVLFTLDLYGDDDYDGILNINEDINGDGDPANDDTDGDGRPNYLDPDDDNDGVPTKEETPNGDTDGDGIPNHLDNDDDDDGLLSVNESATNDCDSDGIVDYLDPTSCLLIPNGFSPNGDGVNDKFVVPILSQYPNFRMEIYNRKGIKVYDYSNKGSTNPQWWDGTTRNLTPNKVEDLPEGVYFHIIYFNKNNEKLIVRWVYLNREYR